VKPDGPGVIPAGRSFGVGARLVRNWIAPFESFKIGDEEIRNTHLRIGEITLFDADMLLGADFFLSHRIYISNIQNKLYFSYNGGAVFNLKTAPESEKPAPGADPAAEQTTPPTGNGEPVDAASYARRGEGFAARRDYEHAIADLTRACQLDPTEPMYLYERGRAYWQNSQKDLALSDFNASLKLRPDDAYVLLARAELRLALRDQTGAASDFQMASASAPGEADLHFAIAQAYVRIGLMTEAVTEFTLWIPVHEADSKWAAAMNGRCWARALLGQELEKALDDCTAALKVYPKSATFLDSRGLVRLRQGDFKKSLADYDEAINLHSANAWTFYGRGIDKLRLGLAAEGQTDIEVARALRPDIREEAAKYGITP
jgi:tetratricopeptide (TPR) repeat protein